VTSARSSGGGQTFVLSLVWCCAHMESPRNPHWVELQLIEVMICQMHWIQFVLIVNGIQLKSMKVNYTARNMMTQEFQHSSESRLIEVINMKMHSIQFVLIVNWIQMQLMKGMYTLKNMMSQEFQYQIQFSHVTMLKSYESICDQQHQLEKHSQKQN
jgi:hypothetical protein